MKRIWLVLAVVMSAASGAGAADEGTATVIFNLRTMAGAASARALTLQPSYVPLADTARTNIFWSPSLTVYPTNPAPGMATVQLAPNVYTVTMVGAPGTFRLTVGTNDVGTTNYATAMSTNLLAIATVPQFVLSTNAEFASYATNAGTAALALNVAAGISNAWRVDATNAARAAAGEVGAAGTNHVTGVSNTLYAALQAVAGSNVAGVASFELRTGAVTLESNDVVKALGYVPGAGGGTGWKLVEPEYAGGGTNTFAPVYQLSAGADIIVTPLTNVAGGGLYTVNTQWMELDREIVVWTNAAGDLITRSPHDELDDIYVFTSQAGATNFDATTGWPGWGIAWQGLTNSGVLAAKWSWTTNYTFGGWGVNGQTPTDGAVLAFGDGLDYTTNGAIWTIFATNIPAPSLGTTNPPAADKVLTLDSNTNLYWATPAAGGGEVTIGTNTIPMDKYFVLLGETSTNAPSLIVPWKSDAPVMASGGFAGKGLLLTDLNASELSSGTVPLARLGTNTASAGQVLTAVDGATEWADAAGGVTLEQVAAGGFLNVTNSEVILNSDTYAAWSTNGAIRLTAQTKNLGIVLSNGFAGASFQNFGPGLFDVAWTLDGTNWSKAMTNAEVTVGVINIITEPGSSDPMGITNLTLLSWTEPSLFGKTNFTRGQILIVDRPKLADAAAPLRTVTNVAWRAVRNQTNWASIPAKSEVDLGGYGERLTAEWKRTATATTNADSLDWVWTGTNVWSVVGPPSVSVSRAEYSVVVSSLTNVLVTLPAAYTSSVPRVLFSHTAKSPVWSRLSSTATATNDTLEVAFTVPNADYGFFRIAIDDGTPSFGTLNGVLEMTPRTITNSNDSTWGKGAGLICVDANYIYVSTGTNTWKRVALGW